VTDPAITLKNLAAADLTAALAPLGVSPFAARRIHMAVLRDDAFPEAIACVAKQALRTTRAATTLPHLTQIDKTVSPTDGFAKYLFRGNGPDPFEAVRIPLLHNPDAPKYIVCVSSQVGCAMRCAFCATGRPGFRRNLAPWEIVDQVVKIRADSPHPIGGVVFMGMGEPMLNYDAVMQAARILSEPCGLAIAGKAISISTVGIIPGIRRFTAERRPYRLVVSLTSADPNQRRTLLPIEVAYPTPDLIDALRDYHAATRRRVLLAWVMMAGINTRPQDAQQLAALTRGLPIQLDLIDVNDPSGRFQPPSDAERNTFRDALRTHLGMPVARRYSGGRDIHAACGMLAGLHRPTPTPHA
jgi:23S rRNA (adenine2503-C2)-methyltransferase